MVLMVILTMALYNVIYLAVGEISFNSCINYNYCVALYNDSYP